MPNEGPVWGAHLRGKIDKAKVRDLIRERDGYKAQSEQRGEALVATGDDLAKLNDGDVSNYGLAIRAMLRRVNAAIDISPEEAREKGR